MKCYYAHPMSLYGTTQEIRDIQLLEDLGFQVVNPSTLHPKPRDIHDCIDVAIKCDVLAFRALPDGAITCGVAKEIEHFRLCDCGPIIELPSGIARRTLTIAQTMETLRELGER